MDGMKLVVGNQVYKRRNETKSPPTPLTKVESRWITNLHRKGNKIAGYIGCW